MTQTASAQVVAGAVVVENNEDSSEALTAALETLETELAAATTESQVQAAKAKALKAGVPVTTVTSKVSSARQALKRSSTTTTQQPVVKKSVKVVKQAIGGSTTTQQNTIPSGGTNIGDTGSTYNTQEVD